MFVNVVISLANNIKTHLDLILLTVCILYQGQGKGSFLDKQYVCMFNTRQVSGCASGIRFYVVSKYFMDIESIIRYNFKGDYIFS